MNLLVVLNAASAWVMAGIIWFVQVVHYPLLSIVPPDNARTVAGEHQYRTSWVVGLPMAVEGVTSLWLMIRPPDGIDTVLAWAGGACVGVALASTVLLSVPRHARMAATPDDSVGRELVTTNWPRTSAWTLHGIIATVMLLSIV